MIACELFMKNSQITTFGERGCDETNTSTESSTPLNGTQSTSRRRSYRLALMQRPADDYHSSLTETTTLLLGAKRHNRLDRGKTRLPRGTRRNAVVGGTAVGSTPPLL